MGAILDIIGSIALRGVILALVMNLILTLRDAEYERTSLATTTQNLSVASRVIEKDLKYAGYNADSTITNVILIADSQEVKFVGDLDNNAILDTVDYRIGDDPSGEVDSKVIARTYNNAFPLYIARGPVSMKIIYYDSLGVATSTLQDIQSVSILLTMKNDYLSTETTPAIIRKEIWVFPANLQ